MSVLTKVSMIQWSRSVLVMLRFTAVHYRCSPGWATVCPGASRYIASLPRASATEPRRHFGESRKTAKPRCGTVAMKCLWSYNRYVISKVQKLRTTAKNNSIRVGEKVGYGVSNDNLLANPLLNLIMKLFRIIQLTWVKLQQTWL